LPGNNEIFEPISDEPVPIKFSQPFIYRRKKDLIRSALKAKFILYTTKIGEKEADNIKGGVIGNSD